jgi:Flp pilus assembly protein TadG
MWDPTPHSLHFEEDIMQPRKRTAYRERGQTLVEFAFVVLLFLVLVFGIIEFGRALWTWNTIVQATRAGARYAIVEQPTADDSLIKKVVVYYDPNATSSSSPVVPGLTEANVTVRYLKYDGTDATTKNLADMIEVSVTNYQFTFLVPLFGSGLSMPAFRTTLPVEGLGAI